MPRTIELSRSTVVIAEVACVEYPGNDRITITLKCGKEVVHECDPGHGWGDYRNFIRWLA